MKKNICLLFLLLSVLCQYTKATDFTGAEAERIIQGAEIVSTSGLSSIPSYIQFRKEQEIPFASMTKWMYANFHTGESFGLNLLNTETDELGITHFRYVQFWNGLPVQGTMWLVHVKDGKIISCNGNIYPLLSCPVSPVLNESASLGLAMNYMNANIYQWQEKLLEDRLKDEQEDPMATYYPKGELYFAPVQGKYQSEQYRLCWQFDIYASSPLKREYIYVDAVTGAVIHSLNRIWDADVQGTAQTAYLGTKTITTDSFSGGYRLRETGRGGGIETYNLKKSASIIYTNTDFTDTDNIWNNVNAQLDQYATDAHYGAEMTYDYFKNTHNRNSINNAGLILRSYVHYNTEYVNAFWDGSRMTYGDGDLKYKPLTAIDIAGHEISHGITQHTSNLVYQGESGALNEGFSDCMGTAVEFYGAASKADWTIGEDIGTPFRNMANPKQYKQPNTYSGTYWYTGTGDYGGVHTNSGVLNYWFYLVSLGGSGTNDKGSAYNISGITMDKAAKILYRAWTVYMVSTSQYADARQYTIQSAIDLYGACTPEVTTVTNAWRAVGIGGAYSPAVMADFSAATVTACSVPATIKFKNLCTNGATFKWYFGDNTSSTSYNPSHTYSSFGKYNVKLVASSGCGADSVTRESYISVISSSSCSVLLPSSGNGTKQTSCTGNLYDNGGPNGNYSGNSDSRITIEPPNANGLKLTFTAFKFEDQYDFFYLYDGPDTNSTLIGRYTGNQLPNGGVIYTPGPVVTVRTKTDPAADSIGFAMNWECLLLPPLVNFASDFDHSCTGAISFKDHTAFSPNKWQWDFGDGTTSTQQNPTHTYSTNGSFTVKLTAYNTVGKDSAKRVNFITIDRPAGPTVTDSTSCSSPSPVTLKASGTGILNWYNSSSGGAPVATGTSYTTPSLSSPKTYYVENVMQDAPQSGGKLTTGSPGGKFDNAFANRYLYFDVYKAVKLVSFDVYAYGNAYRTIEWRNSAGIPIKDTTVYMTGGQSTSTKNTITLNWDLVPGTGYQMAVKGTSNLFRNNGSASYPYTTPGYISITGSNAGTGNSGYYYYFYNWKLQPYACISERTPVTAYVGSLNASVTPPGIVSICPGNSVTLTADGGGSKFTWSNGSTTKSITVSTATDYSVIASNSANCPDTSDLVTVRLINPPVAAFTFNTSGNDVTFSNTSTGANSYTWDFGDGSIVESATNPLHPYPDNNPYTVTMIACNDGCCDTATEVIQLSISTGIKFGDKILKIYPNPFSNNLFIKHAEVKSEEISVRVLNMLGQEIPFTLKQESEKLIGLNFSPVSSGIYYLIIKTPKKEEVFKVIKINDEGK